jgi:hypothetical protein
MTLGSLLSCDEVTSRLVDVDQRLRGAYCLHLFPPCYCLVSSSTLKMEAVCSSETSVKFVPDCTMLHPKIQYYSYLV